MFLVRYGGLDFSFLCYTPDKDGAQYWEWCSLSSEIHGLKSIISGSIYDEIAGAEPEHKLSLTELRRSIYNGRIDRSAKLFHRLIGTIGQSTANKIERLFQLVHRCEALGSLMDAQLAPALEARLTELARRFKETEALKGICLSGPNFLDRLSSLTQRLTTSSGLTQTGFTLLQYISRCAAKTSPFSYFSPVGFGRVESSEPVTCIPGQFRLRSYVALNTQVFERSRVYANESNQEICVWNPSLQLIDGNYICAIQSEHEDTIRSFPVPQSLSLRELLQRGLSLPVGSIFEAGSNITPAVRASLVRAGVVQTLRGSEGRRGGAVKCVTDALRDLPSEVRGRCDRNLATFGSGDAYSRRRALQEINDALSGAPCETPILVQRYADQYIVREDVIESSRARIGRDLVAQHLTNLVRLQHRFGSLSTYSRCRRTLGGLLKQWFPGRDAIPVTFFLQKLFASIMISADETSLTSLPSRLLKISPESEPAVPISCVLDGAVDAFVNEHICRERMAGIKISLEYREAPRSPRGIYGAYIQLTGEGGCAVNSDRVGSGRAVRRWLTYDSDFSGSLKAWLADALSDGAIDADISDDVYYHADTGPRLFDHWIGAFRPAADATENYVPLRECEVFCLPDGELALRHSATGRRIYAHYNSMLASEVRPWMTQFLMLFGRPGSHGIISEIVHYVRGRIQKKASLEEAGGVRQYPRITVEQNTVISRGCWELSRASLPQVPAKMGAAAIVREYGKWHIALGLPLITFIRSGDIRDNPAFVGGIHRHLYKPQYVDWRDPMWVLFFHKHRNRLSGNILVEEAYPDPPSAIRFEQTRAAEYIVYCTDADHSWSVGEHYM